MTVSPLFIVSVCGLNAKFFIVTVYVLAPMPPGDGLGLTVGLPEGVGLTPGPLPPGFAGGAYEVHPLTRITADNMTSMTSKDLIAIIGIFWKGALYRNGFEKYTVWLLALDRHW